MDLAFGVADNIPVHPLLKGLYQLLSDEESIGTRLTQLDNKTIEGLNITKTLAINIQPLLFARQILPLSI